MVSQKIWHLVLKNCASSLWSWGAWPISLFGGRKGEASVKVEIWQCDNNNVHSEPSFFALDDTINLDASIEGSAFLFRLAFGWTSSSHEAAGRCKCKSFSLLTTLDE